MIPQIFKNENLYDKQIENVSKKFNVPVPLIKAFIAIESGFNPNAYRYEEHRKDASYGLMQILYQTAKGFGFKGLPQDLYNPDVNIYWASQYIAYLYKRFGNLPDTFASYNMGLPRPASKTTNIITKIYGKPQPNWKYANQPYVDKGLAYYSYFKAIENKNFQKAWEIYNLIKNKQYRQVWEKYPENNILNSILKWWIILPLGSLIYLLYRRKYGIYN